MKPQSTLEKEKQLGMTIGGARYKLSKIIMFNLVKNLKMDECYRCQGEIKSIEEFSIDHKLPWLYSKNPKKLFFDFSNIAFSHLECNVEAKRRSKKGKGLKKDKVLGMKFSTANNRLRKIILYELAKYKEMLSCYHCNNVIFDIKTFSIEHKIPWLYSKNPKKLYFDFSNIAFSHVKCNSLNKRKKMLISNPSKYKGVGIKKSKKTKIYRAEISTKDKNIHIGMYETAEDAARAYDRAVVKYFGEKAVTNESLGLLDKEKLLCKNCNNSITRNSRSGLCIICFNRSLAKVQKRPSRLQLIELIINHPFTKIGEMYGVSDNAVRKWCKTESLPHRASDVKVQKEQLLKELEENKVLN